MNNDLQLRAELRFNNCLFFCRLHNDWVSIEDEKVYAVAELKGITPTPQGGDIKAESLLICEKCWKTKGKTLGLKDPSKIITTSQKLPDIPAEQVIKNNPF